MVDTYQVNVVISVSHLIRADDVLIFSEGNLNSLLAIKDILAVFSNFSGFEINNEKSSACYSKMVEGLLYIQDIIGFPSKPLPLLYLGIPISGKRKSYGQCLSLILPMERTLSRWKEGEMSLLWR